MDVKLKSNQRIELANHLIREGLRKMGIEFSESYYDIVTNKNYKKDAFVYIDNPEFRTIKLEPHRILFDKTLAFYEKSGNTNMVEPLKRHIQVIQYFELLANLNEVTYQIDYRPEWDKIQLTSLRGLGVEKISATEKTERIVSLLKEMGYKEEAKKIQVLKAFSLEEVEREIKNVSICISTDFQESSAQVMIGLKNEIEKLFIDAKEICTENKRR